jgi:hypothetical protein
MSRIYFHSEDGEAAVRGSERAYGAALCSDLFVFALGISDCDSPDNPHVLRKIVTPSHYCLRDWGVPFERSLSTAVRVSGIGGPVLRLNGQAVDVFSATLNTALIIGSDVVKLYARLHGQCEIHCFVEGPYRIWLAEMITKGRELEMFRPECGWEDVVALLLSSASGPVVTSYSVCESFPNSVVAGWKPTAVTDDGEADWDAWYELSQAERWNRSMDGLRKQSGEYQLLELTPTTWNEFYFGDGMNGFKLLQHAIELSRDAAAMVALP